MVTESHQPQPAGFAQILSPVAGVSGLLAALGGRARPGQAGVVLTVGGHCGVPPTEKSWSRPRVGKSEGRLVMFVKDKVHSSNVCFA